MVDPLSSISGNEQRSRAHTYNSSVKSFTSCTSHHRTQTAEDTNLPSDLVAPSSPFLYEAERSSRSTAKASPSKNRSQSRSPHKVALNDARPRYPLTEETLRVNETNLETPRTAQIKNNAPSNRNYSPSESCLSAFSAIPNADMTMFAKLGLSPSKSPNKRGSQDEPPLSPSRSRPNTPGTAKRRKSQDYAHMSSTDTEDGTMQLMDFTEQLNFAAQSSRSPMRSRNSPSKESREMQYRHQHRLNSPTRDPAGFKPVTPGQARELTNLLDFDLPPAPTPRSIPTITARELESLKAGYLSQISSLKATLSGKEAEISALSAAATDAESRVGTALEQLRDTRNIKEQLEQEKSDWDKRDQETQRVLREVREQIHENENERARMENRLADAEQRAEEADTRAREAESKVASAAAGVEAASDGPDGDIGSPGSGANKAVQVAVEKVARELHSLYKAKHETKVAQLKKSYENRWIKKTGLLQDDVDRLEKELSESKLEIEGLRHELEETKLEKGRVDVMTTIDPSKLAELQAKEKEVCELKGNVERLNTELQALRTQNAENEKRAGELVDGSSRDSPRIPELEARISTLSTEITSLKAKTAKLTKELALSHEENSQLVATVDEFLAMDLDAPSSIAGSISTPATTEPRPSSSHSGNVSRPGSALGTVRENGASTSKPSGLKGPGGFGFSQSRIGMGPPTVKRSASGSGSRSGIMSNIEKMGRHRGADH